MEVIISEPKTVTERTRAPQIYITNPFQEEGVHPLAEISFNSERLQFDAEGAVNGALPAPPVVRRIANVLMDSVTITSPVTGLEMTATAADVAEILAAFYCKWYRADEAARAAQVPAE